MAFLSRHFAPYLDAFVDGLEPLFARFASKARWIVVEQAEGDVVYGARGNAVTKIGPLLGADGGLTPSLKRMRNRRVELRLSAERILARNLSLPVAGRDYFDAIIEHRLERLTPWRPDRVAYGFATSGEAGADGAIAVDFAATSREVIDDALARLGKIGLTASAVGSAGEPLELPLRIDLLRGRNDPGRQRLRRRVAFALALALLLLVPASIASFLAANDAEQTVLDMEQRLRVKRDVLRMAAGAGQAEGRDLELISAKQPQSSVMLLMDRLSAIIPGNTYLTELSIENKRLHLAGRSSAAPALIGLLDADPQLSEVAFTAPVSRLEDGLDSFDIAATWQTEVSPSGGQEGQ